MSPEMGLETSPGMNGLPAAPLVRVGRQAIFDRDRELFGHELLFRAGDADTASLSSVAERDTATSQVLSTVLGDFGTRSLGQDVRFFVNLTRAFIVGQLPLVVGPSDVVLEITEDVLVDEEVLAGLRSLQERGYALAIDDFDGEEHRLPSLPLAHYVKTVLVPGQPERLAALVAQARALAPQARVVVERVETAEDFERCLALGADLFQGYWLERPVVLTSPALDTSRVAALRLLCALADPEVPAGDVERLVLADAAMSLRVLRVASSSAVAARSPITSVRQAVVLLGPRLLSAWAALTVVGAAAGAGERRAATALVLARAGACARLVGVEAQQAYTVGLLSGAAEALGVDVGDLLAGVHLREDLRCALTDFAGPVGDVLAAVLHTESSPLAPPRTAAPVRTDAGAAYASALTEAVGLSLALT